MLCRAATLCIDDHSDGGYGPGSCPNGNTAAVYCDPAGDPATANAISNKGFSGILDNNDNSGAQTACAVDSDCSAGQFCDGQGVTALGYSVCYTYVVC